MTANPPPIEITPLTGTLYKVNARADYEVSFVASAGKDGVLLVDTGLRKTAQELREKLGALGKGTVKYVINTHAHVDHTGGNGGYSSRAGFVEFQHMLQETTTIVLQGLADRKTVSAMQNEKVLEDRESHGDLYVTADQWVENLAFSARRGDPKASLIGPLYHSYIDKGADEAIHTYYELKKIGQGKCLFHRFALYLFGNRLLKNDKLDDAARIFETNIKEYPRFPYNHEALGEIYMRMGENEKAIKSLQKFLEFDPDNEVATEMIKGLRGEK